MNPFVLIMALFAALGLTDKIIGGKMGLAAEFDRGFAAMGGLALSCVGFYCIGITAVQNNAAVIAKWSEGLFFDPSLLLGCLLAPDLGALPLSLEVAKDPLMGVYSGAMVSAAVGATVCYQLPVFLNAVGEESRGDLMRGFVFGFLGLPLGLIPSGLLLGLRLPVLLLNLVPIVLLCGLLGGAYFFFPAGTVRVLRCFGRLVSGLSFLLFGLTAAGIFLPGLGLVDMSLVQEITYMVLQMVIVASGGIVLSKLILTYLSGPMARLAERLGIGRVAVVGLVLSVTQSLAMLPLYDQMDRRGKIVNAAFSVCGAYLLGGQLVFVSSMVTRQQTMYFLLNKLLAGVGAVALALLFSGHLTSEENRT